MVDVLWELLLRTGMWQIIYQRLREVDYAQALSEDLP